MSYDLKIRNGTVVDGTGAARFGGDVGIAEGKIVAVGDAPEDARREIDATDKVVCPGFIDIHTHYDVQILWDPMLTISPWHGVTSVVQGNCGFGIAPTRGKDREFILRTLQDVEGMAYESTMTGLGDDWGFETFPEYLDLIERRGIGINVATLIGHTPLRVWVMGEEAAERQPTDDELREMHRIVAEGLAAGAAGFATTNSPAHHGNGGKPVPSRVTSYEELESFAVLLDEIGHGSFQMTWGPEVTPENIARMLERTGNRVPICDPAMLVRDDDRQRGRYAAMKEAFARGLRWYPQITSLPNMFEVGLSDPFMFALDQPGGAMNCEPLHDLFDEITGMRTVEERWAAYQRPGFREQFVRDTDTERWNANYWPFVYVGNAPGHEDWTGRRIVELAAEQGVKPGQLWFDLAMESHLEATLLNLSGNRDETVLRELLENDHFRLGLGDAGAHNGQICDYRYPTYFLSHWVRELDFPLERAIRMMTTLEAECYGITDRGSITPGLAADVVVFDPETVKDGPIRKVNDLPARMPRLISEPEGVDYVVVNGTVIRDHNQDAVGPEGPFPGKVLREFHRET